MPDNAEFYEKLRTLLNSGIGVTKALGILQSREKGSFKEVLEGVRTSIGKGEALADSLSSFPKHFTPFETSLIRSGEITGNLETSLDYLITYFEKNRSWKRKIIAGLIYPFALLHAAILLPPLPKLIMEGFIPYAAAVSGPLIKLYLVFLLLYTLRKIIIKSPKGAIFLNAVSRRIPIWGKIQMDMAVSRFLKSLGLAIKAGLTADRALKAASRSAGNPAVETAFSGETPFALNDRGITGVLEASGLLSGMFIDIIHTGEESGSVDDALIYSADTLEKNAETLIQRLVIILPVLIYLGAAVYIAGIILRFYAGIFGGITTF